MLNRYPLWKYILLIGLIVLGLIYAIPIFFGEDPSVQISAKNTTTIEPSVLTQVQQVLAGENISYLSARVEHGSILVRFPNTDAELKASDAIKTALGDNYTVALNLAPRTPGWLAALGAHPMKLGLDLQGGVNFLLDVDIDSAIKARQEGDINSFGSDLRENGIRYTDISPQPPQKIAIQFRDADNQNKAFEMLQNHFRDYVFDKSTANNTFSIVGTLTPTALAAIDNYAVDQNISILTNRVNELGVSEAVVQRQGQHQISVELPGIQDTARAKELIGKTATLKFQLVDTQGDIQSALAGSVPLGDRLYQFEGNPVLLKNQVILKGSSITYATAMIGQDGRPAVSVRLGGGGESLFSRTTAENVGKPLATVYIETNSQTKMINGKPVTTRQQTERIINIATIQTALGNNFEITGLTSMKYAQDLALLLRSGALTVPVAFVQERTVGPSLGADNIRKGLTSLVVGTLAVIIFMALYYRLFGLVADLALVLNVIFILAILSVLGGTLTLPGIAGIVLTMGISVDANVLIYERIREELRNGVSPQASIHAGYERAFTTIVDANVSTLIVAMVLFALGSSVVKSFAITLTIGILTSMVTAIFFTRGIINLIYGGRVIKKLSIGIKLKPQQQSVSLPKNKLTS